MKNFLLIMLLLLNACESVNMQKDSNKNKKNQSIQMEVTIEPSIKIKK